MTIMPLEVEQATAHYDENTHVIHVAYRGDLSADVTHEVYEWLGEALMSLGIDSVYGEIFDFRSVTKFADENLQAARKVSKISNIKHDTRNLPVALIVADFYHEEILRSGMRVVPENERKRIVWSDAEAMEFLDSWHQQHVLPE